MRSLALLVGVVIVAIGLFGLVAPGVFVTMMPFSISPAGLAMAAALRVGIGVVLIRVSPTSRAPRVLRVLGILAVAAGVATPLVGPAFARPFVDRLMAGGPEMVRWWAPLALAFGGFITYAVAAGRRAA